MNDKKRKEINKKIGIIEMSDVEYVTTEKIIEDAFEKYKWVDDPMWLKERLDYLLDKLKDKYDLELAREEQLLYFVNDSYVRFNWGLKL